VPDVYIGNSGVSIVNRHIG
jgi:hypothetical protein